MPKILTLNNISSKGLGLFPSPEYEIKTESNWPNAIILRSFKMHDIPLPESLCAIGRAGSGTNNIPIKKCSEKGIVVFNTPGANANAVKELTITSLFLASRGIIEGASFAKSLGLQKPTVDIPKTIELNKKNYAGSEIKGKTLGIIGLGEIGTAVANDAINLGMHVIGYDPFISIESAWRLSQKVQHADNLNEAMANSDYISLHPPLTDTTRGMINAKIFSQMKKGIRILNFSRGEIVNDDDLKLALQEDIVAKYVTDFPNNKLINAKNVIAIPHIGASTQEAEDNCATMVSKQLLDYIENGNIKNSVNYPDCQLEKNSYFRLSITNKNIQNIVGQISTILAKANINICEMLNKSRGDYAYTVIDLSENLNGETTKLIRKINGVLKIRVLCRK